MSCPVTPCFTPVRFTYTHTGMCSGQSNMRLMLLHTFHRNTTMDALAAGLYDNLYVYQQPDKNSDAPVWVDEPLLGSRTTHEVTLSKRWNQAAEIMRHQKSIWDYAGPRPGPRMSMLYGYSALCLYFGQALTDLMREAGQYDVPLGLLDVAKGGSTIDQWSTNATTEVCMNTTMSSLSGTLFNGMLAPFVNMTMKGWLWYQVRAIHVHVYPSCNGIVWYRLRQLGTHSVCVDPHYPTGSHCPATCASL